MRMHGPRRFRSAAVVAAMATAGSVLALTAAPVSAQGRPDVSPAADAPLLGTDQLIVRTQGNRPPDVDALASDAGAAVDEAQVVRRMADGAWVVRVDERLDDADAEAVATEWEARADVVVAEPDRIRTIDRVPNDPSYGSQWHYRAPTSTVFGANLPPAWDVTTGSSSTVVAVLDTGRLDHADLAGQWVPGYDFVSDSRIGNDGNGRDSNPNDPGDWITSTENSSGFFAGCGVSNSSWHGTHVAGTVAAATNNGLGVAGVGWGTKVLPVRVLGKCGGYDSDIIDGLRWAAGLTVSGVPANANPAQVLNLSLGGSGACSTSWQSAINAVTAAGASVVVSAGNSNVNASNASPANCSGVITVAASGSTGSRAAYSNFGTTVEITAPGGDSSVGLGGVLSTLNTGTQGPVADSYAWYQGTSMAAPHVAGAAALIKAVRPSATPAQVLAFLQQNITPFPAGSTCTTSSCGTGLLNVSAAVRAAASVPSPIGPPTATAGGGFATVTWSPPSSDGGTPVTGYTVLPFLAGVAQPVRTFDASTTTRTIVGLTNGASYTFRVAATNAIGSSTPSPDSNAVTPRTVPSTPSAPSAVAGDGAATVTWTAPSNGGAPIQSYDVVASVGGVTQFASTFDASTTTRTISGLANGTTYTFQVAATNVAGTSLLSAASNPVTPERAPTAPAAPAAPTGAPGDASVQLSWAAPDDGGSPITGYVVTPFVGATALAPRTFSSTATTQLITGLTNGTTYTFTVAATNAVGTGSPSAASAPMTPQLPFTAPSAPAAPTGVPLDSAVRLSWAAPDDGGSPITGYVVTPFAGATALAPRVFTTNATTQTIAGLENSVLHTFRVVAINAAGPGPASAPSDQVWPHAGLPQLRVGEARVSEGGTTASVSVTLSKPANVEVKLTTSGGTATAGADYLPLSGVPVWFSVDGPLTKVVTVPILDDGQREAIESFNVTGTASSTLVALADRTGVVTILDDDGLPAQVHVHDVSSIAEGQTAVFRIAVRGTVEQEVIVPFATAAGSAAAESDFTPTSGQVTFSAGEVNPSRFVFVSVANDTAAEGPESFSLRITAKPGLTFVDTTGVATIAPSDGGTGTMSAAPRVRVFDARVTEAGVAAVVVQIDQSANASVVVSTKGATATSDVDFGAVSQTVTFVAGGPTTATVLIPVSEDALGELNETFSVALSKPVGAATADGTGVVTIIDDDGGPPLVRILDATVREGQPARFLIEVDGPVAAPFTIRLAVASGTATAGTDIGAASVAEIAVPAGAVGPRFTVSVPTILDGLTEAAAGETFSLQLTLPSGSPARIIDTAGLGILRD